jgi:hypothetical protein
MKISCLPKGPAPALSPTCTSSVVTRRRRSLILVIRLSKGYCSLRYSVHFELHTLESNGNLQCRTLIQRNHGQHETPYHLASMDARAYETALVWVCKGVRLPSFTHSHAEHNTSVACCSRQPCGRSAWSYSRKRGGSMRHSSSG